MSSRLQERPIPSVAPEQMSEMSMTGSCRRSRTVGIICHRFRSLGGMQTCLVELVSGLNAEGIIPSLIWDEPMDWGLLNAEHLETAHFPVRFAVSSPRLLRLPRSLAHRVDRVRRGFARLRLGEFDFIYSLEAGLERNFLSKGVVYTPGPQYVRVPAQSGVTTGKGTPGDAQRLKTSGGTYRCLQSVRYITIAEWLASEFRSQQGVTAEVVWPPARERSAVELQESRGGVLFLSRITWEKRPFEMIELARALPHETVTVAGSAFESGLLIEALKETCTREGLSNVQIVEDPSEDHVARLLARHRIFVYPGHWEHFGLVTVEAIWAGLLPIVHDSGGQREIVSLSELRFSDVAEMTAKVKWALSLPEACRLKLVERMKAAVLRSKPDKFREEMIGLMAGMPQGLK